MRYYYEKGAHDQCRSHSALLWTVRGYLMQERQQKETIMTHASSRQRHTTYLNSDLCYAMKTSYILGIYVYGLCCTKTCLPKCRANKTQISLNICTVCYKASLIRVFASHRSQKTVLGATQPIWCQTCNIYTVLEYTYLLGIPHNHFSYFQKAKAEKIFFSLMKKNSQTVRNLSYVQLDFRTIWSIFYG